MAIASPEQSVEYCDGTSGAKVEYQNPDRTVLEEDYDWEGVELTSGQMPFVFTNTATVGTLIDTVNVSPGGTGTSVSLDLNKYYTFAVSGVVTVSSGVFYDACFFVDSGEETQEPSDRLTTNDEQFEEMFFNAAENGTVEYNPLGNQYSIGYIGNDAQVAFTLTGAGSGTITIEIYENNYRLLLAQELPAETLILSDQTRDRPFLNLNIACGGDCPTRTSYSCVCGPNDTRTCYFNDGEGSLLEIFKGNE